MNKFIKNWAIIFVVVFIWSYVWHNILLNDFYTKNLAEIARYSNGAVAPLMGFLALGNIMAVFGFVYFIPGKARNRKEYVKNGIVVGLLTWGAFAVMSHAIFAGWNSALMVADVTYSITAGVIGGWLLSKLS